MKKVLKSVFLAVFILSACKITVEPEDIKPRILITSDWEVDDMTGFIRFLLYANKFDIEGLVYCSSQWLWAGDGQGTLYYPRCFKSSAGRLGTLNENPGL
jgi:hypothetical protein